MVGMRCFDWSKMTAGTGKPFAGAASALMDMKSEKTGFRPGKSEDLGFDDQSTVSLKKAHDAV